MSTSDELDAVAEELADCLGPHGATRVKAMFGGRGVFVDDVMTALVDRAGTPHVRGDDEDVAALEAAGGVKHGMPYWSVPPPVWADEEQRSIWLARAVACARRNA